MHISLCGIPVIFHTIVTGSCPLMQISLYPTHESFGLQYNTIQYNTIQHNTIQYDTIRYDTIRCDTLRYDTIRYDIILYFKTTCHLGAESSFKRERETNYK